MADVRCEARVHEVNLPVVDVAREQVDLLAPSAEDEVVGDGLVVLEKVLLDRVALVPEAEDESL